MPRPPRRTRTVSSRTTAVATTASNERNELALDKTSSAAATPVPNGATPASSDRGSANGRRRSSRRSTAASQTPSGPSSDAYGVSDRETKRRASLRQTATTTSARRASAAGPRLSTRGPDASGLDMDDTFADIDTNFGDHDLGDIDDDLDAFDGLDGLGSSPPAAGASGSANATHTADSTSSSFNVGLFRRGRPRQSSIHSRDDAPIRPSSRSGAATPSFGSALNLGTFKRRAREPSILGRRRRDTSRHTSRDRDGETSGSEMDNEPYTSEAESSSMAGLMRQGRQASRASRAARVAQASRAAQAQAQSVGDSSVASSSNTTSMLLMARTRTRGATARKRKSEEGQREDELPKRLAVENTEEAEEAEEAEAPEAPEAAVADPVPPSDTGVMQSVEMASSSPLSTPPRQASLPMSDADRRRYATPGGPDDEIMAPPMSSGSSSASPTMWPSLKGLVNAGRRAKAVPAVPLIPLSRQTPDLMDDDGASDISSPPSLTHSPNYHSRAPSKAKGKAPSTRNATAPKENIVPLTSAALAALLPQRHRRGRSNRRGGDGNDDGDASGRERDNNEDNELERSALLSEDDDELAHGPRRGSLRRGRSVARSAARTPAPANNSRQNATATKTSSKRPVRRMYGSRSFSDKENQDSTTVDLDADESTFTPLPDDAFGDDETTTQVLPARKTRHFGEELENAAKKFKEVDRWTLDYEVVSRSSSPVGAR
ncbi:hypothetical protein SCUCBS95973_006508 [Sporothrix curviconia]|uniref:Uncharacterized protein n=1 Tax=Sporothrix curviconia TaxID=1260050 RepID=A0ABP0C5N0_9PEZI